MIRRPPRSTLFPYNDALPISAVPGDQCGADAAHAIAAAFAAAPGLDAAWHCRGHGGRHAVVGPGGDRKSTRLNSSHLGISYAVFCLENKKNVGEFVGIVLCAG